MHVSLYCEPHNGPVLQAGYEAMMRYFEALDPAIGREFRELSRCLPPAGCGLPEEVFERKKKIYLRHN